MLICSLNTINQIRGLAKGSIKWVVRKGDINFWKDQWLSVGKISDLIHLDNVDQDLTIQKTAGDGSKWFLTCAHDLNGVVMAEIEHVLCLLTNEYGKCIWMPNSDGAFSIKSAWELVRHRDNFMAMNRLIWHMVVPLKWSFLTWRACRGGLPIDSCVQQKGICLASKCNCCQSPQVESVNHVFVSSDVARKVWAEMEGRMGIHKDESLLQLKLSAWWMSKVRSPCHKTILSLIPCCVCWELWLNRNKSRYQ